MTKPWFMLTPKISEGISEFLLDWSFLLHFTVVLFRSEIGLIAENYVIVKNFRNIISQERILQFRTTGLYGYIKIYSYNDNNVHNQNMIYMKIIITNFRWKYHLCIFIYCPEKFSCWTFNKLCRLENLKFQVTTEIGFKIKKRPMTQAMSYYNSTNLVNYNRIFISEPDRESREWLK